MLAAISIAPLPPLHIFHSDKGGTGGGAGAGSVIVDDFKIKYVLCVTKFPRKRFIPRSSVLVLTYAIFCGLLIFLQAAGIRDTRSPSNASLPVWLFA